MLENIHQDFTYHHTFWITWFVLIIIALAYNNNLCLLWGSVDFGCYIHQLMNILMKCSLIRFSVKAEKLH